MSNLINDNSFRLVISANIDDELQYLEADSIDKVSVTTNSTITTQPIVNGDVIADHMFRQPISVSVSGTFSLNGNKPTDYSGASNRLASIQMTFENIMRKGIFCTLTTMNRANSSVTRFLQRNNMVLTSISWDEGQNSVGFTFNFDEAITVDVYDVDDYITTDDENLPDITDATSLDFTDQFLDSTEVLNIIVKTLLKYDLMTSDFFDYVSANVSQSMLIALGIGGATITAVLAVAGISTLITAGTVGSASALGVIATGAVATGPVGLAVAAGVIIVAGCAIAIIKAAFKTKRQKEFVKAFKLYKNDELKNQSERDRFLKYLSNIYENLNSLEDYCQVYGIASNTAQECMLYIDDTYYIFKFERNNTTNKWSCSVSNAEGTQCGNTIADMSSCITDISACTEQNVLFTTSSNYRVYLISTAESKATVTNDTSSVEEAQNDLTNYVIFVSQIDMTQYKKLLQDLIINAMKKAS